MQKIAVSLLSILVLGVCYYLLTRGDRAAQGSGSTLADGSIEEITAEERPFYEAGKPFFEAMAKRDYEAAYAMLSSHARAKFSKNSITLPESDAEVARNDAAAVPISAKDLAQQMALVEKAFGKPKGLQHYTVYSIDKAVLTKTSKEELGAIDSAFAIGTMPDAIPMDIRRASLRGQISIELSDEQLATIAKEEGVTVEELKKNTEEGPYFNLKAVLVDEGGELKVGYFEVRPPSMLD